MEDKIEKWWLLTTEEERQFSANDPYCYADVLIAKTKTFWGTTNDVIEHVKKHLFTEDELMLLQKGWQPINSREDGPYHKHEILIDETIAKISFNFYGHYTPENIWSKTFQITCLSQVGYINNLAAKSAIKKIGQFITEQQETI